MASWVGSVAALLLSSGEATAVANASSPRVELRWSAPALCPDTLTSFRAVERFLGQPLSQAGEQRVAVEARVQADVDRGFVGELSFTTEDGRSERVLEHPDCSKLTEAMALLVAIAIDPERVRSRQDTPPAAPPPPEPVPWTPPAEPSPALTPPPPATTSNSRFPDRRAPVTRRLRTSIAVVGMVGGGTLPRVAPGLGLELGVRHGGLEAGLIGRAWATRTAAVPGPGDASVNLSLVSGGLRLCAVPSRASATLHICARADLGRMSAIGEQVDNARRRDAWFGGLGGSLTLAYRVGRLSPRLGGELLGSPQRPRFGVLRDGEGVQAFRPAAWQATVTVGLAYDL